MARGDEYLTRVVRLFCDHAESPMWFGIGPLDYGEARLSESLETDMRAWEGVFYRENHPFRSESEGFAGWPSSEAARAFTNDGLALAQRLADELGTDFEVEADRDPIGRKKVRLHSDSTPANPDSAAAFRDLAEQFAKEFGLAKAASGSFMPLKHIDPDEQ